ncbi:MAG: hypothetical protein HN742_15970 [Lentisphaerae bacterium]|jgi:hypothetical protein|nr:hypothetical protein [Lentisphaerota bacterium]MBT5609002.1 hypothetical protein [Lentisphaerota bacterium]MBT7055821.1 hypothetical protein [Lentisphaerota bacterium]MBT7843374.1 hypothetical protein [Lentisphaerota bacterium]
MISATRILGGSWLPCVVWAITFCSGASCGAGLILENILVNGGFERTTPVSKTNAHAAWTFADGLAPAGWTYNNGHPGTVALVAEGAMEGKRCLRVKDGWLFQLLKLPSGFREDLGFRLNVRGTGRLEVMMYLYDRLTKDYLRMETLQAVDASPGKWQDVSGLFNCIDDKVLRFALHVTGEVDIDDVVVQQEKRAVPFFSEEHGLRSAKSVFVEDVAIPEDAQRTRTVLRVGRSGIRVLLQAVDGGKRNLTIRTFDTSGVVGPRGQTKTVALIDAGIEVVELKLRHFLRPNPAMLKGDLRNKLIGDWDNLPSPRTQRVALEFEHGAEGTTCLLDGGYAGMLFPDSGLRSITLVVNPDSAIEQTTFESSYARPGYVPVDLTRHHRPGALSRATVTVAGQDLPPGVPFIPPSGSNLDLGVTVAHEERYARYTRRGAYDGLQESFISTVPRGQYTRAWVLYALEDDHAKDAALTVRLTRFVNRGAYSGRARDSLADATVDLRYDAAEEANRADRVGTVAVDGRELPLRWVEVPLDSGSIQDLLFQERGREQRGTHTGIGPYLDIELLGRLKPQDRPHPFGDGRYYPDPRRRSGVHVFAVTLEETPVEMEVCQSQPGNIFHPHETPELSVALRPRIAGDYAVSWTIRDVDDRQVDGGIREVALDPAAGEVSLPICLTQPQVGWYGISIELRQGKRKLLSHSASFALLPPDTRQAGYESPYGTWWFYHHYGTKDLSVVGPLMLKGGFRRAANGVSSCTEADLAPWKVTAAAISWGRLKDPTATDEKISTYIREQIARYPHCKTLLVFHESMPGAPLGTRSAPELFGLPVNEYPGANERWEHATRLAKLVRNQFPDLQICIGNSGAASELIAEGMRRKFPESYADVIGIETVGRTGLPEKLWEGGLPGVWFLRETARTFGYDWGITSCYETNYRQDRLLGTRRQAEWYVRDVMLSHAYRLPNIPIALLHDTGNDYHGSFWGATGLCRRYPLLYPKKAYVAMATVTRVLDRVTLLREVPTGSNSVYALEFARADGQTVYAVWTGRGSAELTVSFRRGADVNIVDLYGRSRAASTFLRKLKLTAGTAVQYVMTSGRIGRIRCGDRTYPEDQPSGDLRIVNAMDAVADWELSTAEDSLLEAVSNPHLPFRTAGDYVLREARDREKGRCLELELRSRTDVPTPLLSEYAVLRLKDPVTLAGEPTTLGVWVKGNSGWGQIYWEITDAAGVRRISCGTTQHDADVFDYDGRVAVNFDGWAFLSFPITAASSIPDLSTGCVANLWESSDRSKPVTYPITLTGVAVSLPQQALHLTEMIPIKQLLRFRDLSAGE